MRPRLAAWIVIALVTPVYAAHRTPVRFAFEIGECATSADLSKCRPYGSSFSPSDRTWIHETVSAGMRPVMARVFPSFEFESDVASAYVLRARLTNGPITSGPTAVFSLAFDGSTGSLEIEYRDAGHYGTPIPPRDVFAHELIDRLSAEVRRREQDIIDALLSRIPVATGGFRIPAQNFFVLSFAEDDLKIGRGSIFRIDAEVNDFPRVFETVSTGVAPARPSIPVEFQSKVLTRAVISPPDEPLRSEDAVTPQEVHLLKREPPPPRLQPATELERR